MTLTRAVAILSLGLSGSLLAVPGAAEVEPALSVEGGTPQLFSGNIGIRIGPGTRENPGNGRGLLLQIQPGLGGGAINVGWTPFSLSRAGFQAVGVAVKARLLRTWGDPAGLEPHQTFGGGEVEVAWIVKVSFGVLTRIGSGEGKGTVFTWGVGVGL